MAKTRTTFSFPDDDDKRRKDLIAAAFILEEKSSSSLLYNAQTIDYITNNVQAGASHVAWYYWSRIPELRYVSRYIANALSVATLYVGVADSSGAPPTRVPKTHPAYQLLEDFAGGYNGQKDILDRLGLHLTVAGDSVLIGPKNGKDTLEAPFDQWRVYSTEEVYSRQGNIYVRFPGNAKEVPIPDTALAIRIWRPHPKLWWDADSPVKGSFEVLKEIDMLNSHILASGSSRLVGAGLLGIPEELDLPGSDLETDGTEVDQFVALLIEIMGMAKKNPESAAARIPVMLRGPADYIDKIKHFDFATEFSHMVPELRMGAIRRLALGMDVPPEILLGSSNSNSWSAWQTDESTLRVHLIPLLQLIASSLTAGWLQPMLETLPLTDAQKAEMPNLVIHFDTSNLRIHQDVSGDAQALYDRFELSADSLRIAMGYGPNNAPTEKEIARQILLEMVKTGNPQIVPYAIASLRDNFGMTDLPDPKSLADELFPRATAQVAPTAEGDIPAGKSALNPTTPAGHDLPGAPPTGPSPNPVGAPPQAPAPATTPVKGPLPGARSQAKQLSPPPIPKPGGDQSNNVKK